MNKFVFGLIGFNNSGKTNTAKVLNEKYGFSIVELSDFIYAEMKEKDMIDLKSLMKCLNNLRKEFGPDILARKAIDKVNSLNRNYIVISGIRSIDDHLYLKEELLGNYIPIYIHCPPSVRLYGMLNNNKSLIRKIDDYIELDLLAVNQGIMEVLNFSDYIIINDPTFPLSIDLQIDKIIKKII